jgi:hypothetical protein
VTDRKEWMPHHIGDAPPDWDGVIGTVFFWSKKEGCWLECIGNPNWHPNDLYRYTPKSEALPSDAALLVAHKRVFAKSWASDDERIDWAKNDPVTIELARMIEEFQPHLLRDPLENVLEPLLRKTDGEGRDEEWSYAPQAKALAAELRKRGVKLEGEG